MLFISADHRLILPSTGFDIIEDVKTLFAFLVTTDFSQHLPAGITLDPERLAVVGHSGGGWAARAASLYATPKPKVMFLQYAQGGELLDDHWLAVKDESWTLPGVPKVERSMVAHLLDEPQEIISYDPSASQGDKTAEDARPSRRGALLLYFLQTGEMLDYVLGEKVSHVLRALPYERRLAAVPEHLRPALLQGQIDGSFPATFLLHGKEDALILPSESRVTAATLDQVGVKVQLEELEGAGHALTKQPDENAEPKRTVFDPNKPPPLVSGADELQQKAFDFIMRELQT